MPLILGLLGFVVFGAYEAFVASHPIVRLTVMSLFPTYLLTIRVQVPTFLVTNRTALSGYIQNFIMGILLAGLSCRFPSLARPRCY